MTKKELLDVYNSTEYIVPDLNLIIEPNNYHPLLDEILIENKTFSWAFISASTPFSTKFSADTNQQHFERLEEQVKGNYKQYFIGYGKGKVGWEDEKSILVLGISETPATELAKLFKQNAILLGSNGSIAKIKWTGDE